MSLFPVIRYVVPSILGASERSVKSKDLRVLQELGGPDVFNLSRSCEFVLVLRLSLRQMGE